MGSLTATITTAAPFDITISWTAPEEPNGIITHYIYTVTDTETSQVIASGNTLETSVDDLTLMNAEPFTSYTVSVFAVNAAGNGEDSTIVIVSPQTGKVVTNIATLFVPMYVYMYIRIVEPLSSVHPRPYDRNIMLVGCPGFSFKITNSQMCGFNFDFSEV